MLDLILHDVEKHLGLKVIKNEKGFLGTYLLTINEDIDVWLKKQQEAIVLKSVIAPLFITQDRESLFIYLMQANFIGQGTGGAIIALDPDEKFLTLSLIIPYEVNYGIFRDRLEDFVNYLDFWKSELKRLETRQV